MRFRRVDIQAFGGLRQLSSGPRPLGDLVVVLGPNEAGKSSLAEFLRTLLYGIYPTTTDRHPFAPWDGAELAGGGRLQLGDGAEVEVTRRLLSTPVGTLGRDGRSEALRNEDLPFVAHVPGKVFRQVHALRLPELAALDREGWDAVQDRILGRLGATDLRPAREVVAELEGEARALWRPDRRGQPRIRQLDEAIRAVTSRRPGARERAAERRRAAERLQATRRALEAARSDRDRDQALLARLRRLIPLGAELAAIDELRARAGDPSFLAPLPLDPPGEWTRRQERVDAARREATAIRADRDALRFEVDAVTADDEALLRHEGEIDTLGSRVAASAPLRSRLAGAEQEHRALDRRLDDECARLPWIERPRPEALMELAPGPLSEALDRWVRTRPQGPEVAPPVLPPPSGSSPIPAAVVLAVGLALAVAGLLGVAGIPFPGAPSRSAVPLVLASGLILSAAGGALLRARARQAAWAARAEGEGRRHEEARRAAADDAHAALEALLAPVGLSVGDSVAGDLLTRIERCRQWIRDREELANEIDGIRKVLGDVDREARRLGALVGDGSPVDAAGLVAVLRERLRYARERATAAGRARARLERVESDLEQAEHRLSTAARTLADLRHHLAPFDADDPHRAAETAALRLGAAREADERTRRLQATHPDLEAIRRELRDAREGDGRPLDAADPVAEVQELVDAGSRLIERLVAESKELEGQVEAPMGEETLDDLEGELRRLREERDRLRREHDRLWILSVLVDEADRQVRETHQPELLRLAGEHLAVLTGGRYDRLEMSDDRSRVLRVSGPALPAPREVGPPLSSGTREQIYVALRLALVRHLDEGGERLPLLLDEILVNWDPERRRRGLDLLEETAGERQVLLFTCHPDLAREVERRGATLWRLEAP